MTGYVTNAAGTVYALPNLIAYQVLRCGGEDGCDSFFCVFPAEAADTAVLDGALRFHAEHEGKRVFTGVVDEVSITLDSRGRLGRIDGRGMLARLLDNQTRSADYDSAQLSDILRDYVTPYGITAITAPLPAVDHFSVDTGDTCRQAVWGYVRHAGGEAPRFDAQGRLLIGQPGGSFTLTEAAAPTAVRYTRTRYGVLSQVVEVRAGSGFDVSVTDNSHFTGLPRRKVTVVSGRTLRAERRTGKEHIDLSERDGRLLEVTLAGAFLAEPDDICTVNLPRLGLSAKLTVRTVRSILDEAGERCIITMGGI